MEVEEAKKRAEKEADEYKNVFDMPEGWWSKWKDSHKDEYTLDSDEFKNTVDVKKGDDLFFVYDKDRNKVFTDRPLAELLKESSTTTITFGAYRPSTDQPTARPSSSSEMGESVSPWK